MIGMVTNTLLLASHAAHEDYFLLIKENLFPGDWGCKNVGTKVNELRG